MTPDDLAGEQPTKPLPQDPGPTEPIVAPHVPVADLSTTPFEAAGTAPGRGPSRLGMWALVGVIAVLGISVIVIGTLWLQRDPAPGSTGTPTPSVSVTPSETPVDDGDDGPSEAPVDPGPAPTTPPEPTDPPDPDPTDTPPPAA